MENHTKLRKLIREMFAKHSSESELIENNNDTTDVPNTTGGSIITALGDPLIDVDLNTMVKNLPMAKNGVKVVPATKKPAGKPTNQAAARK